MKKMDKILEINEADLYVRFHPGIANASKTDSVVPVAKNVDMILNLTAWGVK